MINELKKELIELSDEKYKIFSSSLLPDTKNILGVRIPILRKIAKKISKLDYKLFLSENDDEFFELTIIESMIIGLIKNHDEAFNLIKNFIPKITNWSICDTLCASAKFLSENKERTKKFLCKYQHSKKEFESRFYYVILLMYFIDNDYKYVFNQITKFNNDKYYAKMAAAWCLSTCLTKNFNQCIDDIKKSNIYPWVLKKGLTKAIESNKLDDSQKKLIHELRKKI